MNSPALSEKVLNLKNERGMKLIDKEVEGFPELWRVNEILIDNQIDPLEELPEEGEEVLLSNGSKFVWYTFWCEEDETTASFSYLK